MRLRQLVGDADLEVQSEGFISGVVSQKVTNLLRRLTRRLGRPAAWVIVLPLRPLALLDRPLTRVLGFPRLSVAVCAVKRS
jgi:hypothetical protein